MNDDKKPLFNRINNDYEITGDTKSQSGGFNNTKYVKKWEMYWNTRTSTDINSANNWKIGDTVEVVMDDDKYFGKKGKIVLGFDKDSNKLCIKLKNGKKEFYDVANIKKISIYDYLEDDLES